MGDETEVITVDKPLSYLIQLNYKSGLSIQAWFDKFNIKYVAGNINSIEWRESKGMTQVLFIGMDSIESVVQLSYRDRD